MKTCKSFASAGKGTDGRTEGMRESLGGLLRRHASQALNFAQSLTGNQADAEELVQQASFQALRNWKRYDPLKCFESWYLTMVKNLFIDTRRRLAWRHSVSLSESVGDDEGRCLAEIVADGEPGALEKMERRERIDATWQALAGLRGSYRTVLILCDVLGMSYEDTAKRLRLPLGTVRSRLFRARAALRRDPGIRRLA